MSAIVMVGLGGAGGKAVDAAARMVYATGATTSACDFVAVDADKPALTSLLHCRRIEIGAGRFEGMGFKGDQIGAANALSDYLSDHPGEIFGAARIAVIAVGLGKGGAGAMARLLKLAASRNIATFCILTRPFGFEGEKVAFAAEQALQRIEIEGDCHCRFIIDNDDLVEIPIPLGAGDAGEGDGDAGGAGGTDVSTVPGAFRRASAVLAEWISLFWKMTALQGYLNIPDGTLADTLRRGAGLCHLGYASASGHYRSRNAMREIRGRGGVALSEARYKAAQGALVAIIGGADMMMREISEVMNGFEHAFNKETFERVRMGTVVEPNAGGTLRVVAMLFEEWRDNMEYEEDAEEPAAAAAGGAAVPSARTIARPKKRGSFPFKSSKFDKSVASIYKGENLDKPAFIRRQLNIDLN